MDTYVPHPNDDRGPPSLDRRACNERLYWHLLAQGYCVEAVYGEGEHAGIDHLRVSVSYRPPADQPFQG